MALGAQVKGSIPPAKVEVVPPLYGPADVSAAAVVQGALGTCYYHATMAALANHDPALIKSAIEQASPGVFVVSFADKTKETVNQDDVMFARKNKFDLSDGLWVTVILRGIAQRTLRNALETSIAATPLPDTTKASVEKLITGNDVVLLAYDRAIRSVLYQDGELSKGTLKKALTDQAKDLNIPVFFSQPVVDFIDQQGFFAKLAIQIKENGELFGAYRGVGNGGLATRVMTAFGVSAKDLEITDAKMAQALLIRVRDEHAVMVVTSRPTLPMDIRDHIMNGELGHDWWVNSHAYTVLGYDPDAATVTLRNPWGRKPVAGGVFVLAMQDFMSGFSFAAISR